jgi:hypothetical protein
MNEKNVNDEIMDLKEWSEYLKGKMNEKDINEIMGLNNDAIESNLIKGEVYEFSEKLTTKEEILAYYDKVHPSNKITHPIFEKEWSEEKEYLKNTINKKFKYLPGDTTIFNDKSFFMDVFINILKERFPSYNVTDFKNTLEINEVRTKFDFSDLYEAFKSLRVVFPKKDCLGLLAKLVSKEIMRVIQID